MRTPKGGGFQASKLAGWLADELSKEGRKGGWVILLGILIPIGFRGALRRSEAQSAR